MKKWWEIREVKFEKNGRSVKRRRRRSEWGQIFAEVSKGKSMHRWQLAEELAHAVTSIYRNGVILFPFDLLSVNCLKFKYYFTQV